MTPPQRFSGKRRLGIGCSVVLSGLFLLGLLGALTDPNAGKGVNAGASVQSTAATTTAHPAPTPPPSTSPAPPTATNPAPTAAPTTEAPPPPPAPTTHTPTPAPAHTSAPAEPAHTSAAPTPPPPASAPSCAGHTTGACGWDVGVAPKQPGETATCADGSVSFSTTFSGTCSHHGGVEYWYK